MFSSLIPKKTKQIKTNDLPPGFNVTYTMYEGTTNKNGRQDDNKKLSICLGKRM